MHRTSTHRSPAGLPVARLLTGALLLLVGVSFTFPPAASAAEEIKVRHILVRKRSEAEAALDSLVNKGVNRNNFILVCRDHSMDPVTKGSGGDLGWNTRNKFVPEFSGVAFELAAGEVSEPVRTPYGWHLIFVEEKRETKSARSKTAPKPAVTPPTPQPVSTPPKPDAHDHDHDHDHDHEGHDHEGHDHEGHDHEGHDHDHAGHDHGKSGDTARANSLVPSEARTVARPLPAATPNPAVNPRVYVPDERLMIYLEAPARSVPPTRGIEVHVSFSNQGKGPVQVPHSDLWPLGFSLRDHAGKSYDLSTEAVQAPSAFLVELGSRAATGRVFLLHDYFQGLESNRRLWLSWTAATFQENLRKQFAARTAELGARLDGALASLSKGRVQLKGVFEAYNRPSISRLSREIPLSIFEVPSSERQYYAKLTAKGEASPIWFALDSGRQLQGVRHFITLALNGYYDGLQIFDLRPGSFVRGGCPRNDGTSGPNRRTILANTENVPHQRGTLSLVTRASGRGNSREAGSIFFISLKDHPAWDSLHVPIGTIVEGEDALERLIQRRTITIDTLTIVPRIDAPESVTKASVTEVVRGGDPASPAATSTPPAARNDDVELLDARGLPRAIIETSKGNLTVELFQDDARNTVSNFVNLAEKGYFDANPAMRILDRVDGYYVRTGSPDNSDRGSPGYRIASETANNTRPHEKGVLTMCLEMNAQGKPVPDTAGSQFMICLNSVPFWNGVYTPFGKVVEGLDVLEKLQAGDQVKRVRVISKRQGQYNPATTPIR